MDLMAKIERSIATGAAVDRSVAMEVLEWVDAASKLPPSGVKVICWGRNRDMFVGHWDCELTMGWISDQTGLSVFGVTHWARPVGPSGR
jgi:hypothetical protein